jgi:hypothetical protein
MGAYHGPAQLVLVKTVPVPSTLQLFRKLRQTPLRGREAKAQQKYKSRAHLPSEFHVRLKSKADTRLMSASGRKRTQGREREKTAPHCCAEIALVEARPLVFAAPSNGAAGR